MADLDTRTKRASSVQIMASWVLAPVLPDGTIGEGDRAQTLHVYAGGLVAPGTTFRPHVIVF